MEPGYRSYAAQTGHYFDRPHSAIPSEPVVGPAAWRGDALDDESWCLAFDAAQLEEIEAGLAAAEAKGRPLSAWKRDDIPLPGLSASIDEWRRELTGGRGFLLVRGLPVERWGRERSERFFWSLGLHLGTPGAQNPAGDLLGHVEDTGEDEANPQVRLYRTSADIAYHCDAADAVGLLCLDRGLRGGASRIASSVTVWNLLQGTRPELAARLFEPVRLDLRNEERPGMRSWIEVVPCRHQAGQLRTFYHSDYFRSVERHADAELSELERELFDAYDDIAQTPGVYLDMDLEPGDVQLVSNHTIVHARTAYQDAPSARRHLLRLWLSF